MTGVSLYIYQDGNIGAADPNLAVQLKFLRDRAERAQKEPSKIMLQTGVNS